MRHAGGSGAGRVTVVVPTYNRAALLPRALESVLRQTVRQRCDIVVVDDGSTDDTAVVAARYAGQIRYLRQANEGVSAARNAGICTSDSEFVAFLDSDDTWEPEKIERQLDAFGRHPAAVLVAGCIRELRADGSLCRRPAPLVPLDEAADWAPLLFKQNFLATTSVTVRRAALVQTGLFNRWLPPCEDYHLWVRLSCLGPGVFLNALLATYTMGAPFSLAQDTARLLLQQLRARYLLRRELAHRPDCRRAWQRGIGECLATLRDHAYRTGDFGAAAGYGYRSLMAWPRGRGRWEWARFGESLCRAALGPGRRCAGRVG